jgi:uncharacterized protein YjiS (DUF1127 family)
MYIAIDIYWINVGRNPTFPPAPNAPLETEETMATRAHTDPAPTHDAGAAAQRGLGQQVRAAGRTLLGFADAFSGYCHRVRAYNELANLTPQTLHDIGRRRDELDRVLAGEVPRRKQHESSAGAVPTNIP